MTGMFGQQGGYWKGALSVGPDVNTVVFVPHRGGVVRFDIALMHGCSVECPFDRHIGIVETLLRVVQLELEMGCDMTELNLSTGAIRRRVAATRLLSRSCFTTRVTRLIFYCRSFLDSDCKPAAVPYRFERHKSCKVNVVK